MNCSTQNRNQFQTLLKDFEEDLKKLDHLETELRNVVDTMQAEITILQPEINSEFYLPSYKEKFLKPIRETQNDSAGFGDHIVKRFRKFLFLE